MKSPFIVAACIVSMLSAHPTSAASSNAAKKVSASAFADALPALENVSDTRVLKWKDGKRAVFMIGFDDSAPSHIHNVIPELKRRGIPGAFYINPGNPPYKSLQADWEAAARIPGIELVNHTFTHLGGKTVEIFDGEIVKCNEVINHLYPERKTPRLITWGKPGVPKENWGITSDEIQSVLVKHHMIERPLFMGPPFSVKTIPEMNALVDKAIASGEMEQLTFHGVGADWHVASLEYFNTMLDRLEAERGQLWLTNPLPWHQYKTERETAKVRIVKLDPAAITLELTSEADPVFYDYPLSLQTRVPASWTKCVIAQGETRAEAAVENGVVSFEAIPGAGVISIQPAGK